MDLSIVIPILEDHQRFLQNYAEYTAFFQKFGIQFEILVVCSDSKSHAAISQQTNTSVDPSSTKIKLFLNSLGKSRNNAISLGILNATGKVIVVATADQMTPLASYFAALQAFMSDPNLQIVTGNRLDPKRLVQGERSAAKLNRIKSHNSFFKDIFQLSATDPTTPFLALRNTELTQHIAQELKNLSCWYYTPFWLNRFRSQTPLSLEISIQENYTPGSKYKPFADGLKVYWSAITNR